MIVGEQAITYEVLDQTIKQAQEYLMVEPIADDAVLSVMIFGMVAAEQAKQRESDQFSDQTAAEALQSMVDNQINPAKQASGQDVLPPVKQWLPGTLDIGRGLIFQSLYQQAFYAGSADELITAIYEQSMQPDLVTTNPRFGTFSVQNGFAATAWPWSLSADTTTDVTADNTVVDAG
jgi:hypothetical protein